MIDPRKFQKIPVTGCSCGSSDLLLSLSWASINLAERRFTTEAELHFIQLSFHPFTKKSKTQKNPSGHLMWTPYRQVKLHVCHDKDVQLKTCVHMQLIPAVKLLTSNL